MDRGHFLIKGLQPVSSKPFADFSHKEFGGLWREEKNECNTRGIQIKEGSFSLFVLTSYSGSRRETDLFITFLCGKLANKMGIDYSKVVDWFRSKLSFTLLRSSFLCIRGSRDWLRVTNQVEVKNLLKIFNWYFVYVILFTMTTPYIGLAGLAMP